MDDKSAVIFGNRVRARRKELNLSQTELALKAGYSEKSSIARIESGQTKASIERQLRIAAILRVPIAYLWGTVDNPNDPTLSDGVEHDQKVLQRIIEEEVEKSEIEAAIGDITRAHMETVMRICTQDAPESSRTDWIMAVSERVGIVTSLVKENEDYLKFRFAKLPKVKDQNE